ncbi:unnamed protein product, partial [Ectocarpus sp. 12 AP-2014]
PTQKTTKCQRKTRQSWREHPEKRTKRCRKKENHSEVPPRCLIYFAERAHVGTTPISMAGRSPGPPSPGVFSFRHTSRIEHQQGISSTRHEALAWGVLFDNVPSRILQFSACCHTGSVDH